MIPMKLEGKLAMTIATVAFAACAHSSWAAGESQPVPLPPNPQGTAAAAGPGIPYSNCKGVPAGTPGCSGTGPHGVGPTLEPSLNPLRGGGDHIAGTTAAGAGPAARIGGDRLPASRGGTGIDGTPPGPGDDLDGSAGIDMMGPRNPLGGPYTQTK